MQGKKILVIDDDPKLRRLIEYAFLEAGAEVTTAQDGSQGLRQFYDLRPDLVILDLMMPNMDGWETCKNIRQLSDVPIIMVTARGRDEDVIQGLELGADDYIVKPFNVKILISRARATLRRAATPVQLDTTKTYHDEYLTIDLDKHRVIVAGQPVELTATEFRLLAYLLENAGRVMTFAQILENVWGWEYTDDAGYIRVYIWHLRRKIERDSKNPVYLQNVQGIGYRFEKQN